MDHHVAGEELGGCRPLLRLDGATERETDDRRRPGADVGAGGRRNAVSEPRRRVDSEVVIEEIE